MLTGADEDVAGRLRLNILEGKNIQVLINEFRRYLFLSDLAEQAVIHKEHPEFQDSKPRVYSWELRVGSPSSRLESLAHLVAQTLVCGFPFDLGSRAELPAHEARTSNPDTLSTRDAARER